METLILDYHEAEPASELLPVADRFETATPQAEPERLPEELPVVYLAVTGGTRRLIEAAILDDEDELGEDGFRARLPLLYELMRESADYTRAAAAYTAEGREAEIVMSLSFSPESQTRQLEQAQVVIRPKRLEAEVGGEGDELLPEAAVSASYSGEYQLTEGEITIMAGDEPWVVTIPEEGTDDNALQIWRLRDLITELLEGGEGTERQTESVMERFGEDETSFIFTATTYCVVDGRVIFESVTERWSLETCISQLESGVELPVFDSLGQQLSLEDLYARRQPQEEEPEEEETEVTETPTEAVVEEQPSVATATELASSQVVLQHEHTEVAEHRTFHVERLGSFTEEQLLAAPLTVSVKPPEAAPLELERPFSLQEVVVAVQQAEVAVVPAVVHGAESSKEVNRTQLVRRRPKQRERISESRPTAIAQRARVRQAQPSAQTSSTAAVRRSAPVVAGSSSAARTIYQRTRARRVAQHGKSQLADLTAVVQLASFGAASIVGPAGTPAHVLNQALAVVAQHYQAQNPQSWQYALVKGEEGYILLGEQAEIKLEETVTVTRG